MTKGENLKAADHHREEGGLEAKRRKIEDGVETAGVTRSEVVTCGLEPSKGGGAERDLREGGGEAAQCKSYEKEASFDGVDISRWKSPTPPEQLLKNLDRMKLPLGGINMTRIKEQDQQEPPDTLLKMIGSDVIGTWEFDILDLDLATKESHLVILQIFAEAVLDRFRLFETLDIPREKFRRLMRAIGDAYNSNLYHCVLHGCDVLHAMQVMIFETGIYRTFPPEEVLAYLLCGPLHDVGHPGVSGPTAQRCADGVFDGIEKDDAMMERYHANLALELITFDGLDIISHLPDAKQDRVKNLIHSIIMHTCIHGHDDLVDLLKTRPALNVESEDDRELWLGCLMHIGDLANPAKKWQTHVKWSHAVIWEFYSQGTLDTKHSGTEGEKRGGAENEEGSERGEKADEDEDEPRDFLSRGRSNQKAFIARFVLPLFEAAAKFEPSFKGHAHKCIAQLRENERRWGELGY